jgi:hypothetical protein
VNFVCRDLRPGPRRAHNGRMAGEWSSGRLLREAIAEAVVDGYSIDEIEVAILEPAEVSEDARDALWLFAWGCLERRRHIPLAS